MKYGTGEVAQKRLHAPPDAISGAKLRNFAFPKSKSCLAFRINHFKKFYAKNLRFMILAKMKTTQNTLFKTCRKGQINHNFAL